MSDHIPDLTKMIGETPRTDESEYGDIGISNFGHQDLCDAYKFARQLERELNEANERIKRMEEAGDKMADLLRWQSRMDRKTSPSASAWRKAKEDKP
jgi:G3E family GTPase